MSAVGNWYWPPNRPTLTRVPPLAMAKSAALEVSPLLTRSMAAAIFSPPARTMSPTRSSPPTATVADAPTAWAFFSAASLMSTATMFS